MNPRPHHPLGSQPAICLGELLWSLSQSVNVLPLAMGYQTRGQTVHKVGSSFHLSPTHFLQKDIILTTIPWPSRDFSFQKLEAWPTNISCLPEFPEPCMSWVAQGQEVIRTCCQCRSFIPGLQEILRMGMCCLNFSIFIFTFSAKRLGAGTSTKALVNL